VQEEMARMVKEFEERAAKQEKMFEQILARMSEMSAAKKKPQPAYIGCGAEYEARG
jgi:GTP cyclohydrolase I